MGHLVDLWSSVAILCGLAYMGWVFFKQLMLRRSRSWPATTATIIRSEPVRKASSIRAETGSLHIDRARIEYNYMVGTRVYRGSTICVGSTRRNAAGDQADALLERYPLGASVPVFYDPAHPEICCLEHCAEAAWIGYLLGATLALFGLLLLLGVIHIG